MRNSFVTFAKSKKIMPLRGYLVGTEEKSVKVLNESWGRGTDNPKTEVVERNTTRVRTTTGATAQHEREEPRTTAQQTIITIVLNPGTPISRRTIVIFMPV